LTSFGATDPLDPRRPGAWLIALLMIGIAIALGLSVGGHSDFANLLLTTLVLVITAATAWWLTPTSARFLVLRPDELGYSDLLFFVYSDAPGSEPKVPRDVLLQLHVAVVNVGGRKGLLSSLRLLGLRDASGSLRTLPGFPEKLRAHVYTQVTWRRSSRAMRQEVESQTQSPPLVLGPDDVVLLRFRARRGIDWSPTWTLDAVHSLSESLASPIVAARIELIYRRGTEVVHEEIDVPCVVEQQELYRSLLGEITDGFRRLPMVPQMPIEIE
jgi:hypothetical protein